MSWIRDRWQDLIGTGSGTWLAWAAWAALAVAVIALVYGNRQVARNRRLTIEQVRPHVGVFMEPHAADWHVIELVIRNFGKTAAYDIELWFPHRPTVAEYERAFDNHPDITELQLPRKLTTLAPGQDWRTVWDSAPHRVELGDVIESRFTGTVTYYNRPDDRPAWKFWQRGRRPFETKVVLDWGALPPVPRVELMTVHDLAKREKQKLELLRGLLTYFYYVSTEPRADVFRGEIDRINGAVRETHDRWRARQHDEPADAALVQRGADEELGKHHHGRG